MKQQSIRRAGRITSKPTGCMNEKDSRQGLESQGPDGAYVSKQSHLPADRAVGRSADPKRHVKSRPTPGGRDATRASPPSCLQTQAALVSGQGPAAVLRRDRAPVEDWGLALFVLSPPSGSQRASLKPTWPVHIARRICCSSRRGAFEAANGCSGLAHQARPPHCSQCLGIGTR